MQRARQASMHYKGEKPREPTPEIISRNMETEQIRKAKIVRNTPPTQEFMALGYNRENILDRVARADFWGFNYGIDPNFAAEYGKNGKVDFEHFVRSITVSNGINGNQFIWDAIPELENFPVSGFPEQVSQQYVLYNVDPAWHTQALQNMHIHAQSVPTAYNAASPTSQPQSVVYQTPITTIYAKMSGSSIVQKIKQLLVGNG